MLRSLYLPDSGVDGKCLTDQPNPSAPQEGVHVYHFVASLCSRKVRVMLALKGVAYESHHVVLPAYQQYEADYVRINPRCVVPTLVVDGKVTTDSHNILDCIERRWPGDEPKLTGAQAKEVQRQSAICDGMPIEALSYGANPDGDKRPGFMQKLTKGSHAHKEALLAAKIEKHADEPQLAAAYKGKLAVVSKYRQVIDSADEMRALFQRCRSDLQALEKDLAKPSGSFAKGGFLCAPRMTAADVEWSVILGRLREIRFLDAELLAGLPHVARYSAKVWATPAFQQGVQALLRPSFMIPNVLCVILGAKCGKCFAGR